MKKLAIFIATGLVIIGIVFLVYRWARKDKASISAGETIKLDKAAAAEKTLSDAFKKISETDQDLDGLTDAEEKKYGTNPARADTDGDGILDKDEMAVYRTNPLKADTDGDKIKDGDEVRRGLNPNGPGKLSL